MAISRPSIRFKTIAIIGDSLRWIGVALLALSLSAHAASVDRPAAPDASQGQYAVIAPIFTGGAGGINSYIRLVNNGGTDAGKPFTVTTYTVQVVGSPSGTVYGSATIQVAANAAPQYSIDEILALAKASALSGGDTGYALYLQNPDLGTGFMHVVYNGGNGFFENASACQGYLQSDTQAKYLFNVHTSGLSTYPSQIYIHNYANTPVAYRVTVRDARTGLTVGSTNISATANSTTSMPFSAFEQLLGWTPAANQQHANMTFEAVGINVSPVLVSTFIINQVQGTTVNMSSVCQVNELTGSEVALKFELSVTKIGLGSGSVTSSPSGISCGLDCTRTFNSGVTVTLTATKDAGSTFVGWGGACSGTAITCDVMMTNAKGATATFGKEPGGTGSGGTGSGGAGGSGSTFTLTLTKGGTGTGSVSSSPIGIDCGSVCTKTFTAGTSLLLTASPTGGAQFQGWSGACSGATTTCQLTMNADQTATASFGPFLNVLSLSVTGHGQVNSSPQGIVCGILGTDCAFAYATGTTVSLSAGAAGTFSKFQGWTGACASITTNSGDSICNVVMNGSQSVTANFAN